MSTDLYCPEKYRETFAQDWLRTSYPEIRRKYTKADGTPYSDRTYRRWAQFLGASRPVGAPRPGEDYAANSEQEDEPETLQTRITKERYRQNSQAESAEWKRDLKYAAHVDRILDAVRDSIPRMEYRAPRYTPSKATALESNPTDVLAFISDCQIGERVHSDANSGMGRYSLDAFYERAGRYYETVSKLIKMHRTAEDIRHLHIVLGGDIIEGTGIYASQPFNLDVASIDQVKAAVETFSDMFSMFTQQGLTLHIHGVPGNHGRMGRKGEQPYMNNLDRMVYIGLKWRLENYPNITWHISDGWLQLIKVRGHLFAIEHGDSVKGSLSIPAYGLKRRHGNLITLTGEIIEAFLIGHHHTPTSLEVGYGCKAYINGCWVGPSDFSMHDMGVGGLPSQLLLGINEEHGIVWERQVHLSSMAEMRQLVMVDHGLD